MARIVHAQKRKAMTEKLKQLVESINQLTTEIADNELLSVKHSKIALDMAITTGGLLGECKKELRITKMAIGWETWFAANIKGFELRTAQNYMKLYRAKTKDVAFFDDCESIAQAYNKIADNIVEVENPAPVTVIEVNGDIQPASPPAAVPPVRRKVKLKKDWKKVVRSKVKWICKMVNEHPNPEMYALLGPIVQLYMERPIQADVLDGGKVITTTHRLTDVEGIMTNMGTPTTETESEIVTTE
jgi:hypothetical protein